MVIQVRNRVSYLSTDSQTSHNRMLACTQEHRKIIEAIAAGDSQAAEKAMRDHINALRDSFFRRLIHT
jgi:DNA-binding GntR family transcriptional regulator